VWQAYGNSWSQDNWWNTGEDLERWDSTTTGPKGRPPGKTGNQYTGSARIPWGTCCIGQGRNNSCTGDYFFKASQVQKGDTGAWQEWLLSFHALTSPCPGYVHQWSHQHQGERKKEIQNDGNHQRSWIFFDWRYRERSDPYPQTITACTGVILFYQKKYKYYQSRSSYYNVPGNLSKTGSVLLKLL